MPLPGKTGDSRVQSNKESELPKIAFIGAGSTVFAQNLIADILGFPELSEATLSLHDIDVERLCTTEIVAHKIARQVGASPFVEASLDRRVALDGADYVISMIQVGGYTRGCGVNRPRL